MNDNAASPEQELTMSVGRDYRLSGRYEYVIFQGEIVIHRSGCFKSSGAAKRAGLKAARALMGCT